MEYILGSIFWGLIFWGAWKWFLRDIVMPHPLTSEAKGWWKASRVPEETYYAYAADEIKNGKIRTGLWAKALVDSMGDETKARALYIKLRVQAMRAETATKFQNEEQSANIEDSQKITIGCPGCGATLRVVAGKHLNVKCPKCHRSFEART